MNDGWEALDRPVPQALEVDGTLLRPGSRVRLAPRARGDVFDRALAGRTAVVEGIDADVDGRMHVAVTLDDDPGQDFGRSRHPGHRFYFGADEVEPLRAAPATTGALRVLVAGIGNVFLGDDGFGVEVARRLAARPAAAGVEVADFGIRGLDLVYALQAGYDAVVLIDATARGEAPGTLYVIEPDVPDDSEPSLELHAMDPVRVLAFARALGAPLGCLRIVGCEPAFVPDADGPVEDMAMRLSPPVEHAVPRAVELVESLVAELRGAPRFADAPVDRPETKTDGGT